MHFFKPEQIGPTIPQVQDFDAHLTDKDQYTWPIDDFTTGYNYTRSLVHYNVT